jgi:hypothetical protein
MTRRVYVYWNLHRDLYSIREGNRVRRHTDHVHLQDVTFCVGEGGRQRVLATGQKNVHAGLRGEECSGISPRIRGWRRISYDPYKFDHFVTVKDERPILHAADVVGVVVEGRAKLYARGLEFA